MTTTLNQGVPAREAGYEMTQYLAGRVTADPGGATVNRKIGTVPIGSIITSIITRVATAYTGGTPALALGTASGGAQVQTGLAVTAGSAQVFPLASLVLPTAADTDVWASLSGGATAGDGYVLVFFAKPVA